MSSRRADPNASIFWQTAVFLSPGREVWIKLLGFCALKRIKLQRKPGVVYEIWIYMSVIQGSQPLGEI